MAKSNGLSLDEILKNYGVVKDLPPIGTGIDVLDELWGGGITLGYMYSLWGQAGCGKSTIAFQVCGEVCRKIAANEDGLGGKHVVIVDTERALNDSQKAVMGLDVYEAQGILLHLSANNYADIEEIAQGFANDGSVALMVIDSMSEVQAYTKDALTVADIRPGMRAQQAGNVLPKMKTWFYKAHTASILIFHARASFQMGYAAGPTTKQEGGFSAEHIPDIITKVVAGMKFAEEGATDADKDNKIGQMIYIETTKNKFCKPFQKRKKRLLFGVGVSVRYDILETALDCGIIKRTGNSYIFPSGLKVVGRKAMFNVSDAELLEVRDAMRSIGAVVSNEASGEVDFED